MSDPDCWIAHGVVLLYIQMGMEDFSNAVAALGWNLGGSPILMQHPCWVTQNTGRWGGVLPNDLAKIPSLNGDVSRWKQLQADAIPELIYAGSLARRAEAVSAAAALRAGAASSGGMAAMADRIDPASMSSIFSLLKQQNDALRALEVLSCRDWGYLVGWCVYGTHWCSQRF